jgi:protein TonB
MFDKLIESSKEKETRHAGRYFVVMTVIYCTAVVAIAAGTIIGFSPVLAEGYALKSLLAPPPVPLAPAPAPIVQSAARIMHDVNRFAITRAPDRILPATDAARYPVAVSSPAVIGAPPGSGHVGGYVPGGGDSGEPAPPPPNPKPATRIEPAPTSEINRIPPKVSEGVLQGKAIRRVKPNYPAIARSVRASGPVSVLVVISEAGQVIEATAVGGHPLLRSAAVEAARQWLFSPTTLSNVPVKVQGVLTFNFVME